MGEKATRTQRTCANCGTSLKVSSAERNPKKWCSRRCRGWARAHPGEPLPVARSCQGCGSDITGHPLQARFCSKRCNDITRGRALAEPYPDRKCALPSCDAIFTPVHKNQRCCCETHGKRLWHIEASADGRKKPEPWNERRRTNGALRRARKKGATTGAPVRRDEIAERDGWRCHLCRTEVDRALAWPHPMSPSMDHLIPLSKGGSHDPANVRLAHLRCNTSKGNRAVGEQLLLFG